MKAKFPILVLALCPPDRILSLGGVLARLKVEIPHAHITLVTTMASSEFFEDDDIVDDIQALDGAIFKLKSLGVLSELSRRPWGLCIDLGPTMVSKMMRAKTRFGYSPSQEGSAFEQICRALHLDVADVRPVLRVSSRREARIRTRFDNGRGEVPLIAMAPGAGWLGRKWPTERFAVLATRLQRQGGLFDTHRLLIVGEEADHDALVALSMATPRATIMERQMEPDAVTGERNSYLDIYAALRHAALFVGNDEIWLNLAAAAGIPAFGLFGPSDESLAATGVYPLRGPRPFAEIQAVDPKLKSNDCHMLDLSIDKVYDGIDNFARSSAPNFFQ